MARPDNTEPYRDRDWTSRQRLCTLYHGAIQIIFVLYCRPIVPDLNRSQLVEKSNVLNDKRIKSCLSRFDSGAYSRLQFLRAVSHSVGAHTESPQPRVDNSSNSNSSEDEDDDRQEPAPAAPTSGRRNRQRQPRQQPRMTVAKCASWRHVLASHWCRADIEHVDTRQYTRRRNNDKENF